MPLLESRVQARGRQGGRTEAGPGQSGVERHTQRLIRVEHRTGKSFADFAAFDLALNQQDSTALARMREGIGTTDPIEAQLHCLFGLLWLEPSPRVAGRLLDRVAPLLGAFERAGRWQDLASWIARCRRTGEMLREARPDVAEVVGTALAAFCTPERHGARRWSLTRSSAPRSSSRSTGCSRSPRPSRSSTTAA